MAAPQVWMIDWRKLRPDQRAATDAALTTSEKTRAARFRQPADRDRFCVGRGLLRLLSAQRLQVPPDALDLRIQPRGKPYWHNPPQPLGVNLSHAGDRICIAIATDAQIGVDVQDRRAGLDLTGVAATVMHPAERAAIASAADPEALFYALWTLREAAIKATGDGFLASPSGLNALPLPQPMVWVRRGFGAAAGLDLLRLPAPDGYAAALAVVAQNGQPPAMPVLFSQGDLALPR